MDIKHKIINFYPATGSLVVNYYTDEFSEGFTYSIDIPMDGGIYPDENGLLQIINMYAPKGQIERLLTAKVATVPDYLAAHIQAPLPIIEMTNPNVSNM